MPLYGWASLAGRISARSTLIVSGPDVRLTNLDLDGTLIIRAVPGAHVEIRDLAVKNKGWAMEPLKGGGARAPEELRVRGCVARAHPAAPVLHSR